MAKKTTIEPINYKTSAKPKAYASGVPVFCAHDAIVDISELRPNPRNPNRHPREQIRALGEIIRAAGWRGPITVSKRSGLIVRGHGRLLAAQLEDLEEAPVDYQEYASEAEEMADLVADNRLAELSEIDQAALADLFSKINTDEIPISLCGYTANEYENIVGALADVVEDMDEMGTDDCGDINPPAQSVTAHGDLWILGRHRLLCGDATNEKDLKLLCDTMSPDIYVVAPMVTVNEAYVEDEDVNIGVDVYSAKKSLDIVSSMINKAPVDCVVADLFGASGLILSLCERANKTCLVMGLTPGLCDAIVRGYIEQSGNTRIKCIRRGKERTRSDIAGVFNGMKGGEPA